MGAAIRFLSAAFVAASIFALPIAGAATEQSAPLSVARLIALLSDADAAVRGRAIVALERMGAKAAAAIPGLVAALDDPDDAVRWTAAGALGNMGTKAHEAIPALAKALGDRDPHVRAAAAAALTRFGSAAVACPLLYRS